MIKREKTQVCVFLEQLLTRAGTNTTEKEIYA